MAREIYGCSGSGAAIAADLRRRIGQVGSSFDPGVPWSQAGRSLKALLPGVERLPDGRPCGRTLTIVSAGTTPWVAWPYALHALSLGWNVLLKDSSDSPQSGRFLKSVLRDVAPGWSSRLHPVGTSHAAVHAAIGTSDAVVVYGSDRTVQSLRDLSSGRKFLGFPHAVSCAVWKAGGNRQSRGVVADLMMYRQLGCLSPQVCFVLGGAQEASEVAMQIAAEAEQGCRILDVSPVSELSIALRVGEWRETHAALGSRVHSGDWFRWTIASVPAGFGPTWDCAFGVLPVVAVNGMAELAAWVGPVRGRLSSIGVAGDAEFAKAMRGVFPEVSRVTSVGRMQCPSLSWRNGGVDPAAWLGDI